MKKFFLGFFLVFIGSIFAQTIDVGGPLSWHFSHDKNFNSVPEFTLPNKYIEVTHRYIQLFIPILQRYLQSSPFEFHDKMKLKTNYKDLGVRVVPQMRK